MERNVKYIVVPLLLYIILANSISYSQEGCRVQTIYFPSGIDCNSYEHGDWILVFEDEFNGDQIDRDKWYTCEDGWNRVHGDELQYYRDENVSVSDGVLHLTAKEEPGQYSYWAFTEDGSSYLESRLFQYTSGWVQTKAEYKYGLIEARCKIPEGSGLWPAFWLFGNGYEIDVYEFEGQNPAECHFNVHKWDGESSIDCGNSAIENDSFAEDFHIYSIEWDEFTITYRIDGDIKYQVTRYTDQIGRTIDNCQNLSRTYYVFDRSLFPRQPMSIRLNLAISSGNYGDMPNSETPFPSELEVDYVKVYKRLSPNRILNLDGTLDKQVSTYVSGSIALDGTDSSLAMDSGDNLMLFAMEDVDISPEIEFLSGSNVEITIAPGVSNINATSLLYGAGDDICEDTHLNVFEQNDTISGIIVSPNPNTGHFTVEIKDGERNNSKIILYDFNGGEIQSCNTEYRKTVDFNITLSPGIYTIILVGDEFTKKTQFIVI